MLKRGAFVEKVKERLRTVLKSVLRSLRFLLIIFADYAMAFFVVNYFMHQAVLAKTAKNPIFIYLPYNAAMFVVTSILGIVYFTLKKRDNAITRRTFPIRLVLETKRHRLSYMSVAFWLWGILLIFAVVQVLLPYYFIEQMLMVNILALTGYNTFSIMYYDQHVLHQLFLLLIVYQFLREIYLHKNAAEPKPEKAPEPFPAALPAANAADPASDNTYAAAPEEIPCEKAEER